MLTILTTILEHPLTQDGVSLPNPHFLLMQSFILYFSHLLFDHTHFLCILQHLLFDHTLLLNCHLSHVVVCFFIYLHQSHSISSQVTPPLIPFPSVSFCSVTISSFAIGEEGPRTKTFYKKSCYVYTSARCPV